MSCIVEELAEALAGTLEHLPSCGPGDEHPACSVNPPNVPQCKFMRAIALIKQAREHDCIPVDDVKAAAQDGTRW